MYFPNWIVIVDNQKVTSGINGAHGVISLELPVGKHIVRGRFTNTLVRTVANSVSVLSLIILFSVAGIYLFIEAVRYSSSFSLLDGGPIDIDQSINSADVNGDLENGSSDVTIFFETPPP